LAAARSSGRSRRYRNCVHDIDDLRADEYSATLEALDDALVNGGAMMTPDGFLDTSTLVVGALENGMARGTTLEADDNTDVRVDRLMAAASLVYRLRQLLRQSKEEEKEKEQRQGKVVVGVLWVCCGLLGVVVSCCELL
jgi:methanogenic corrinoid protein MtbC1